jgi:hypothetical protein
VLAATLLAPHHLPAASARANDSIATIVASPLTHIGKTVTVSGVMVPGWKVCAGPLGESNGRQNEHGASVCIGVADYEQRFLAQAEKYDGARVTITGVYWHRCLPTVRDAEPEVIREYCDEVGKNGWLGPIRVRIGGYTELQVPPLPRIAAGEATADVTNDPWSHGVDELALQFLAATRKRSVDAIAALMPLKSRGRFRVTLRHNETRDHWLFLSDEMTKFDDGAARKGSGYRHYQPTGDWGWTELCFCRSGDCNGQWPSTREGFERPQNLATPFVCHRTERVDGRWYLD